MGADAYDPVEHARLSEEAFELDLKARELGAPLYGGDGVYDAEAYGDARARAHEALFALAEIVKLMPK